jgi:hypothetical protein
MARHRGQTPERIRAAYLRDAMAAAAAGEPLARICTFSRAASRIRKLTDAEATAIVLARRQGKRNPPRDPIYAGAFPLPTHPRKSKDYADGDTAAVASPHKPGRWEVWMFGMDDPSRGETWNYVGEEASRAAAEAQARKLLAYF